MITYNGLDLFSSGPSRIEPGPVIGRQAVVDAPGSFGATVIGQGVAARTIRQRGRLVADSQQALFDLIDAIAAQVDAGEAALVNEHERSWEACVMTRFEHEPPVRIGPRRAASYTVSYVQARP